MSSELGVVACTDAATTDENLHSDDSRLRM